MTKQAEISNTERLSEAYCVECEEHVGFFVVGGKLGQVPDPDHVPFVVCDDCGYKLIAR